MSTLLSAGNRWLFGQDATVEKAWLVLGAVLTALSFILLEAKVLRDLAWHDWWDQGKYLQSAIAFAHGDLSADQHWYPPGYSLLAAPFVYVFPKDPFVVVNLLCLLGSFFAFIRLAKILDLPASGGVLVFLGVCVATKKLLRHFVLPWTTTPTCFLILLGLCICLQPPKTKNSFILGLCAGFIVLTKPIDVIALIPAGLYYLFQIVQSRPDIRGYARVVVPTILGLVPLAGLAVLLHWRLYGHDMSTYERMTFNGPVFMPYVIGARFYSLFVDPLPLYGTYHESASLLSVFPWLLFGAAGMIIACYSKLSHAALALSTAAYTVLYVSYYDFTPSNIWHYNVLHYFIWVLPMLGLFGLYAVKQIIISRSIGSIAVLATLSLLLCLMRPSLQMLHESTAEADGQAVTLNMSGCTGACVVHIDVDSAVAIDEENSRLIVRVSDETRAKMGPRSLWFYPDASGIRMVLLDGSRLGEARLTVAPDYSAHIQKANISALEWPPQP